MLFEKCECDIASYADDNTPRTYYSDLCKIKTVQIVCSHGLKKVI